MQKAPELKRDSAQLGYSKVIYPNIRRWMLENECTYYRLAKKTGFAESCLSYALRGQTNPTKPVIDAILTLTGMTYEEAFKEGG